MVDTSRATAALRQPVHSKARPQRRMRRQHDVSGRAGDFHATGAQIGQQCTLRRTKRFGLVVARRQFPVTVKDTRVSVRVKVD